MKVANTGSVSLSYDGDLRASYLVVDGQNVSVRRVEYDREREADDLLHSGLPHADWLCQILRSGGYRAPQGGIHRFLQQLAPDQWACFGIHTERGRITVRDLAVHMAGHDANHIEQIRRILRRMGRSQKWMPLLAFMGVLR